MPEGAVAKLCDLCCKLHSQKTLTRVLNAFVFKLPAKFACAVTKNDKLFIQKINGTAIALKRWEFLIHNSLVALLIFAKNFDFPF